MLTQFVQKLFALCQGRHTFFALFFTIAGTTLAAFHRLEMPYVAMITAIQGYVLLHSGKDDYFKNGEANGHQ
jgi:hypothetical protein